MTSLKEFIERIAVVDENGCWNWPRDTKTARPRINFGGKNHIGARLVLEMKLGRPLQAMACHHCDNPRCVNPDHLYEADQSTNLRDGIKRGRLIGKWNALKTHCYRGHEYNEQNTHYTRAGFRQCRVCRRVI